ncbi:MAG TPA: phycobilisome rod-core linker polypeptide, partial [Longimicrobium sp.]|nr:phycobilisome rod-core linker polypeptide [Longimicrobium sp.]
MIRNLFFGGPGQRTTIPPWWTTAAVGLLFSMAVAGDAAAQSCAPNHRDVALAAMAQVQERGGGAGIQIWVSLLDQGGTVKGVVSGLAHSMEYRNRFITGRAPEAVLTDLYRHIMAREPDSGAWGFLGVASAHGWDVVIDALIASAEYNSAFGDHIVPGSPVVAWDCARANGVIASHHAAVRDATPGGASVSYTTPAYVSLDQPRALTFVYSSGLADARSSVQFDVVDNSGDPPNRISLQVKNEAGGFMTFTDGSLEVFFHAGAGASRIAAEFREPQHPNRSVGYTAVVRKHWADGRTQESLVPTRAANLTASTSEFGHGWELAGFQRLYDQGDGINITESGTGRFFWHDGADPNGTQRYRSPSGDFTAVTRTPAGAYERRYPDGTLVRFAADGRMTEEADRFGNRTQYQYDGAGRLGVVVDPVGKTTTLAYNGAGAVAWVEDPAGRRSVTTTSGRTLWQWWDPDQSLALDLHFVDGGGRGFVLEHYWMPGGSRNAGVHTATSFGYDAHGRVASVTAPQVATTDAGTVRPVVLARSLQAAVLAAPGTGTDANRAPRVVPADVRVGATDPRGNSTWIAVDPFGGPTRIEEPLGRVTTITRDRHGRAVRTLEPSGRLSRVFYRGVEIDQMIDDATGAVVRMEYEPVFHQLTHAWGTGTTEVWNTYDPYDPARKLATSRSGTSTSPETHYGFDARGRIKSVTDPEGHGAFYDYGGQTGSTHDNLRTVRVGTASSTYRRTTTVVYDRFGRDSVTTSPTGDVTRSEYDLMNRVRKTVDPENGETAYDYVNGNLYRVRDPKGQFYHFHHDALGRTESEVDPRGQWSYYNYDRAGNPTYMRNRRQQEIRAGYNALNQREWRDADGARTTWSYDPNGRWSEAANAESHNRVEYDIAGRPRTAVTTLGGVTYTQVITPNTLGRRKQMDVHGPWSGARTIAHTYTARGQLETLRDLGGNTTTFQYNDDGQVSTRSYPTGLDAFQGYASNHVGTSSGYSVGAVSSQFGADYKIDARGLVEARVHYRGYQLARIYGYDRRGWLRSFNDRKFTPDLIGNGGPCTGGEAEGCLPPDPNCSAGEQHDPDTGVCLPQGTSEWLASQGYTYDAVGNRTDRGAGLEPGNRLVGFDGQYLAYDADGNLTRKVRPGYDDVTPGWNSLGQMDTVWRYQRGTVKYGYDAFGRRVRRTAPDGTVMRYLYDGDDLLMELDGPGNPVREYTHLPGVDQPHSLRVSATGANYYYAMDNPGSVAGLIGGANQVVNAYQYTPWGELEPAASTEAVTQPLRYMAREWDEDAGMYQVRARWYDPQLGRFV